MQMDGSGISWQGWRWQQAAHLKEMVWKQRDLGWTPQIPVTKAIQRNETAITQCLNETWPALKERARRDSKCLIFMNESGFYLLPGLVKTYAPKGGTPVLYEWQTRDHLSVMGAVTPTGKCTC